MHSIELALAIVALVVVTLLGVYDLRTRLVPNNISLPLLGTAVSWRLTAILLGYEPVSSLVVYVGLTAGIFALWFMTPMGGGDAKLWMALAWLTPSALFPTGPVVFGLIYGGATVVQALLHILKHKPVFGVPVPATWRIVPYAAWLVYSIALLG